MGWVNPTGFVDEFGVWSDETNVYDDDLGTRASIPLSDYYLELTRAAIDCSKIQVYFITNVRTWTIDIYYSDDWHNLVTDQSYAVDEWHEIEIGSTQSVTAFRIKKTDAGAGYLAEADFWEIVIVAPTVTTQAVSSIGTTTATGNGNITATGGEDASVWGTCLATTANPDTGDTVDAGSGAGGTGAFTTSITGLSSPVKYHVRAYATNSAGTSYGADVTFITVCSTTANLSLAPTVAKSWNRTVTTNTALSLATTVVMIYGRKIVTSSALSVTTSISKAVAYARATSSSLSLTPTISKVVAFARATSSNLSLTTTITRLFARTKTVSCALSVTPTISRVVAYVRATSSNLSLAVTIVRTFGFNITTSCNLSLTTTINRVAAYTRAVSINLSLTTTISKVVAYIRATSSNLSLTTSIAYIVHRWKKIKDFTGRAIQSFTGRDIKDDSDQFRDIKNP